MAYDVVGFTLAPIPTTVTSHAQRDLLFVYHVYTPNYPIKMFNWRDTGPVPGWYHAGTKCLLGTLDQTYTSTYFRPPM